MGLASSPDVAKRCPGSAPQREGDTLAAIIATALATPRDDSTFAMTDLTSSVQDFATLNPSYLLASPGWKEWWATYAGTSKDQDARSVRID
jgi:hypothetical protein